MRKDGAVGLIIGVIVLAGAGSLIPGVSAGSDEAMTSIPTTRASQSIHWCQPLKLTFTPYIVYPKENTVINIGIENGIGDSLDIFSASITFDWGDTYQLGSTSLQGYAGTSIPVSFKMPDLPAGVHSTSISIRGQAVGDWVAETCSGTWNTAPEVHLRPPLTVDLRAPASGAYIGEPLNFQAVVAGGTPPYQISWTFGDGGTGQGENVQHAWSAAGPYVVKVIVRDALDRQESAETTVTIGEKPIVGGGPGGAAGIGLGVLLGVVAIVIVVVLLLIWLLVLRKKRAGSPTAQPPPVLSAPPPAAPAPYLPPAPVQPAAPPPPPAGSTCPTCGTPTSWVSQYAKWHCARCGKYPWG